ncbi:signal recognition particle-docking protein FtsY [Ilumatobacter coccineus]|uniref:Signal recognition particle receptor FtsY n=1 Tax=Ilumatobacter coccineus (strain NBRC 103263 / KCTC 29153 / YM16-304) TaxID=1313172 RepID=A0A6C7E257_ILUCY|nr:signal recognition particle-docking protein FtsY [Ilumatobacter coccineus]BAN02184.1 signal recognition particle receptor [Ilumatobacter coccineus YM16-304]
MGVVEILLLVAIVLVVVFGVGVVVLNRRREAGQPPAVTPKAPTAPPPKTAKSGTILEERTTAEPEPVELAPEPEPEPEPAPASLRDRLAKARSTFAGAISGVLGRSAITDESFEDLEEALLRADVGVSITDQLLDVLRAKVSAKEITEPSDLLDALQEEMASRLRGSERDLTFETLDEGAPNVWMFVGVNGVGKTTTIGKLANQQVGGGRTVLLAAGDTFRAAAAEQLNTWAERSGADFVRGAEGGDPSSVIFDGVERAASKNIDIVMADTAGRLHTKSNLMDELKKVRRVAEKGAGQVTETLLVIDATTGQNGLIQAKEFNDATDVTGVVLTKLDGSAKGGIVFAIETDLGIPVKLVGIGETIGDLIPFDPDEFVTALFER